MRFLMCVPLVWAAACDDIIFLNHGGGTAVDGDGFCALEQLVSGQCLTCHSAAASLGGLDLETDLHGTLVDQPSGNSPGEIFVVPGDPDASLLQAKLEYTQTVGDGMPPGGMADAAVVSTIRDWIADGASADCATGGGGGGTTTRNHPVGWSAPAEHGLATKLQTYADCRTCHGAELEGELGPACDTCHQGGGEAWRTTCTFCHGGELTDDGAPPRDIDGTSDPDAISFPPHLAHVEGKWHSPFACTTCHAEPTDVLTPGHLFDDDTPAVAEVDLSAGLSSTGTWAAGSCSDVYCHGDGQTSGEVSVSDAPLNCEGCHSTGSNWQRMSGRHGAHLSEDVECAECHPDTVDSSLQIIGLELHVNGTADFRLPVGMDYDAGTCTGQCHGETHNGRSW